MAEAKYGDTVRVHYTGKLEDGTVFDTSLGRDPVEFVLGAGEVIPGFEEAVVGMTPGESKTVEVLAEQAYGPYLAELVLEVDRSAVPLDLDLEVGMQLVLRQPQGRMIPVTVTKLTESRVTLDANHPLAGKDLTFDIQLMEVV
ncbi:MAG TPA: peptidylprolyl isomerase [Anaerolineae bacterium]|nr:peptidylprolyl isomerase [Anaerolineae bacterium]